MRQQKNPPYQIVWLRYCRFLVTSCQVTARVDTKWFQQFQRVSLTPWNSSLGLPCRKKRRRVVEKTKAKRKKLSSRREYSELLTKCSPMTLDKRDRGALRAFVCVRSVGPGEIRPSAASFTATINHNLAGHSVALARAFVGHRAGVTWNRLRTSLSSSSPPRRISRSIPQDTNHEWRRCVAYGSLTMTRCGTPLAKRQKNRTGGGAEKLFPPSDVSVLSLLGQNTSARRHSDESLNFATSPSRPDSKESRESPPCLVPFERFCNRSQHSSKRKRCLRHYHRHRRTFVELSMLIHFIFSRYILRAKVNPT